MPLNGTNTHPVDAATRKILDDNARQPMPVQSVDAGAMDRTRRKGCMTGRRTSPSASHKGRLTEGLCEPATSDGGQNTPT